MNIRECYAVLEANLEDALTRLPSEAFVAKFVKKFPYTGDYETLVKAMEDDDKEMAYRAVHTFKGMSSNLSLTKLANLCTKFCNEYKKGEFGNYASNLEAIKAEYLRTINVIKQLE